MTPYEQALHDIGAASSFDEITAVVERFSVASGRAGGALYSGKVGDVHSGDFVAEFKGRTDVAIIDETERAKFLSDKTVSTAIRDRAEHLFRAQGLSPDAAAKGAGDFLFGDGKAVSGPTTVENSQWGRASREFVATLKGDVAVLATGAAPDRVFGRVELKAALANPEITSLGGVPIDRLRAQVSAAHGDVTAVLDEVQARFRADVGRDAFLGKDGKLVLSREFADAYHLKGDFPTATELQARGLSRLGLPGAVPVVPRIEPVDLTTTARPNVALEDGTVRGGGNLARNLGRANVVIAVAALGYDAVRVGRQYEALQAHGNAFAASTMVRNEALATAGSIGGSILLSAGAGAAWGLAGGSETGPGALVTGAIGGVVGGVIGALGGQKLASELTQRELDTQLGADGQTYRYKDGRWAEEHTFRADRPAPASQIPTLNFRRAERTTELVLGNPPKPDPNRIDATDPQTKVTRSYERSGDGWQETHWSGLHRVTETASPALAARLTEASAQRAFIGTHGTEVVANAFVADYYGKGWDKLGPLPQAVTTALNLPSETRFTDPQTQKTWDVNGNDATRTQVHAAGRFTYRETVHATGDELRRALASRDAAVAHNHIYGAGVIQRGYDDLERRLTPAPSRRDGAAAPPVPLAAGGVAGASVQARLDSLREYGTALPDVARVTPFDHRPHTGSFVKVSDETVALHVGRGEYQLLDVARDLHGAMPPEGRPVTIDPQGHVQQPPAHALARP